MFLDPTVHLDWTRVPERQLQLMDAAERLFAERGYDDTPVSVIVAAVGVAQGTFYNYFESKSALLDAICDRLSEETRLAMLTILEADGSAIAKLVAMTGRKQEILAGRVHLFELIHEERNDLLHARLERHNRPWGIAIWLRMIEQGRAEGVFRVDHPRVAAILLFDGLSGLEDEMRAVDATTAAELFAAAAGICDRILGADPGTFIAAFAAKERP